MFLSGAVYTDNPYLTRNKVYAVTTNEQKEKDFLNITRPRDLFCSDLRRNYSGLDYPGQQIIILPHIFSIAGPADILYNKRNELKYRSQKK